MLHTLSYILLILLIWIIFGFFIYRRIEHIHNIIANRYAEETKILQIQKKKIITTVGILIVIGMVCSLVFILIPSIS